MELVTSSPCHWGRTAAEENDRAVPVALILGPGLRCVSESGGQTQASVLISRSGYLQCISPGSAAPSPGRVVRAAQPTP